MKRMLVAMLLVASAVLGGCAYVPPVGVDLYAGRQPIGCGTLKCQHDLARYHERLARERARAWERARRRMEDIHRIYNVTIPAHSVEERYNRCLLNGGNEVVCADLATRQPKKK